jgi:peptidoglycan hydrolase-like protein with peptidoglycan-binding domain
MLHGWRIWALATGLLVAVLAALAVVALLAWPRARLDPSSEALARVVLPQFAGRVESVRVDSAQDGQLPVRLRQGGLFPERAVAAGERLTVELKVRRPGWASWLVGRTSTRTFTVETPVAHLSGQWLQVKTGSPVAVTFDQPVSLISFRHHKARRLANPRANVDVGVVARGSHSQGVIAVAAAARSWELLSPVSRVTWFPAQPLTQLLTEPRPDVAIAPGRELRLTFSKPVQDELGSVRPQLKPATPGRWRLVDAHTLIFRPAGPGFAFGSAVHVVLPKPILLAGDGTTPTTTVQWHVPLGSTLRLQQVLAQLGYLPVDWVPANNELSTARAQLAASVTAPAGRFVWRYPKTPPELQAQWQAGQWNEITRGAVMMFESTHGLVSDGLVGPKVWRELVADALGGKRRDGGYTYVFVHRNLPQSLNLWHNGRVILKSPGNTGVPAAPTQLGTYPVFEHILSGTMSGTNPDGSHYNDPGIQFISYFHHGDALHAFNRASFGTPQSLGCVELPLAAAAKVWPYTPIGTLVTIEN